MAFRIGEHVTHGEIDNRERGRVVGRIWLLGVDAPLELDLQGNAWEDLAGVRMTFRSREEPVAMPRDRAPYTDQSGMAGDITASRKVRVFDIPFTEAYAMLKRKETPPEHWANSLYIEWFSERNGRVVIELADPEVELSEPTWRLTPEDREQAQRDAQQNWETYFNRLSEAVERERSREKDPEDDDWNEHDYEQFFRTNDARNEKYRELLDKYGDAPDAEEKIARAMGWISDEPQDPEQARRQQEWIDALNAAAEEALDEEPEPPPPHLEGVTWVRNDRGDIVHPLQHRSFESCQRFYHILDAAGLLEMNSPLRNVTENWQICCAKLAGGLNSVAQDDLPIDGAFVVAYLKRALGYLHEAQQALEAAAPDHADAPWLPEARRDLHEIRQGILEQMDHFRGRGTD